MQAPLLALTLCALQLCPAVLGGPQHQRFVLGSGWPFRVTRVRNFAWQNCFASDPGQVKSLSVTPDPICIPGDVTLMASGTTTIALESPLKIVVILQKRIGDMWLKIPCVEKFGSCTYEDFCEDLNRLVPPGEPCPEPLKTYSIPCHCPFKAGTYNFPRSDLYVPKMGIPSFIGNGDYRVKAVLSNGDQQLGCIKAFFSLDLKDQWFW